MACSSSNWRRSRAQGALMGDGDAGPWNNTGPRMTLGLGITQGLEEMLDLGLTLDVCLGELPVTEDLYNQIRLLYVTCVRLSDGFL